MPHETLPFWHFNVPVGQRTPECPAYLLDISDKDRGLIGKWDADYEPMTWDEVQATVNANRLASFHRSPSELRRYRKFVSDISHAHGSVLNFMLQYRLCWTDTAPHGAPFTDPRDVKILYNDWPYGLAEGIVHLVVWTKFTLPEDPLTGDLTKEMRATIASFVDAMFTAEVGQENVVWFKNWKSLKSVRAIEHFHVLLANAQPSFIDRVTGGDRIVEYA